jgi:hypothetical protein
MILCYDFKQGRFLKNHTHQILYKIARSSRMCGSYKMRAAGAGAGAGAGALKEWIVHSNPFLEFLFGIEKCYFTFSFTFLSSWNIDKHGIVLQFRPGFCRLLRNWYFCLLVLYVLLIRSIQQVSICHVAVAWHHTNLLLPWSARARIYIYIYICLHND